VNSDFLCTITSLEQEDNNFGIHSFYQWNCLLDAIA